MFVSFDETSYCFVMLQNISLKGINYIFAIRTCASG